MTVIFAQGHPATQMKTFEELKRGLTKFYGNALFEYNNQGILSILL